MKQKMYFVFSIGFRVPGPSSTPFFKGLKTRNTGVLTRNTSVCSVFFLPKMLLTYDPKMVSGGAGFG
jgi:hypothetical protein